MSELLPYQGEPWKPTEGGWLPEDFVAPVFNKEEYVNPYFKEKLSEISIKPLGAGEWSYELPMPKFKGPYIKQLRTYKDIMQDVLNIRIILELPDPNSHWTKKGAIQLNIPNEALWQLVDSGHLVSFIIDRVAHEMLKEFNIKIDVHVEMERLNNLVQNLQTNASGESYANLSVSTEDHYQYDFKVSNSSDSVGGIVQTNLTRLFPGLLEPTTCPVCKNGLEMPLKSMIIHLNDRHKWSRLESADWVESLDIDTELKEENV